MAAAEQPHIISQWDLAHFRRHVIIQSPLARGTSRWVFPLWWRPRSLVLFQTPSMYMPYLPLFDEKGYASIDVCGSSVAASEFLAFFESATQWMAAKIAAHPRWGHLLAGKIHISCLKEADALYSPRLKMRGAHTQDIYLFHRNKQPATRLAEFTREEPIQCLVHLKHLWVSETHYGFACAPVQMRKLAYPAFSVCLLTDVCDMPLYAKYKAMHKAGVLMEAIRHKMAMDGVAADMQAQVEEALRKEGTTGLRGPPTLPPPLPPPLPPTLGGLKAAPALNPLAFLADITKGAALRKVEPKPKQKPEAATKTGFQAPSLQDLLNARQHLKKTRG